MRTLKLRYERFCKDELAKFDRVLMIAGNHEFYSSHIDKAIPVIGDFLAKHAPNATLMDGGRVEIDGVAFLGCTLWAACGASDPVARFDIGHRMNDFRLVAADTPGRVFTPEDVEQLHVRDVKWLTESLAIEGNPSVVITHHAPLYHCDSHGGSLSDAYTSNMQSLINDNPALKAWIFGHTHEPFSEKIFGTTVVSNPRGYAGVQEIANNFKLSEIEIACDEK
jgi:hypothetical protein